MIKLCYLFILKYLGGFWLCRKILSNKTLILAYHGFEIIDETSFRDKLFIKQSTFIRRLDYLIKYCNVVPLNDCFNHPDKLNKVVITIDDGWDTTRSIAAHCLQERKLPYTVYLTTQDVLDNEPIFHIALDYILTKNIGKLLQLTLNDEVIIDSEISLENKKNLLTEIVRCKKDGNDTELLQSISRLLKYDFNEIVNLKALTLMNREGVSQLYEKGADIQLHTHSHNTPLNNFERYTKEIEENRRYIKEITDQTAAHHCYPSGQYNDNCFDYLKRLNVKTATTCKPGFCDEKTNPYELPRFLDGENIPQIVFEAEVSGVLEILRKLKK